MDEAEFCDRVLLIDKGEKRALDTPLSLKNKFLEEYKIYEIKTTEEIKFEKLLEKKEGILYTRTKDGFKIFSLTEEKIKETVEKAKEMGIVIKEFKKSEPDLEEVFYARVSEM